jgi:hypothetical protein
VSSPRRLIVYAGRQQDNPNLAWNTITFDKTLVDLEPEQGVPRYVTVEREQHTDYMVRRGIALIVNHGFAATEEGQKDFLYKLATIAGAVQETCDQAGVVALLRAKSEYKQHEVNHSRNCNSAYEAYQPELWRFGIVQHAERGWYHLDAEAEHVMRLEGIQPDTWIVPPRMTIFAAMGQQAETEYSRAGPDARANLQLGQDNFTNFRNKKVYEIRPYQLDVDGRIVDPLNRERQIGDFFVIPYYGLSEDADGMTYPVAGKGKTQVYCCETDRFETFTWEDAWKDSNLDAHSGVWNIGDDAMEATDVTPMEEDDEDDTETQSEAFARITSQNLLETLNYMKEDAQHAAEGIHRISNDTRYIPSIAEGIQGADHSNNSSPERTALGRILASMTEDMLRTLFWTNLATKRHTACIIKSGTSLRRLSLQKLEKILLGLRTFLENLVAINSDHGVQIGDCALQDRDEEIVRLNLITEQPVQNERMKVLARISRERIADEFAIYPAQAGPFRGTWPEQQEFISQFKILEETRIKMHKQGARAFWKDAPNENFMDIVLGSPAEEAKVAELIELLKSDEFEDLYKTMSIWVEMLENFKKDFSANPEKVLERGSEMLEWYMSLKSDNELSIIQHNGNPAGNIFQAAAALAIGGTNSHLQALMAAGHSESDARTMLSAAVGSLLEQELVDSFGQSASAMSALKNCEPNGTKAAELCDKYLQPANTGADAPLAFYVALAQDKLKAEPLVARSIIEPVTAQGAKAFQMLELNAKQMKDRLVFDDQKRWSRAMRNGTEASYDQEQLKKMWQAAPSKPPPSELRELTSVYQDNGEPLVILRTTRLYEIENRLIGEPKAKAQLRALTTFMSQGGFDSDYLSEKAGFLTFVYDVYTPVTFSQNNIETYKKYDTFMAMVTKWTANSEVGKAVTTMVDELAGKAIQDFDSLTPVFTMWLTSTNRADTRGRQQALDLLCMRPFRQYTMGSGILVKKGSELGNTFRGWADFQLTDNIIAKVHPSSMAVDTDLYM